MRQLNTEVSAVHAYSQRLGSSYMHIAGEADNVQRDVTQMQQRVQQAEEDVKYQRQQAAQLEKDAGSKAEYYGSMRESAEAKADSAQRDIQYVLDHPIAVTHEDSEGNTYTEYHVDETALAAARSRYDQAMSEVYYYEGKERNAHAVAAEAAAVGSRFENLHRGIAAVNGMIQQELYQIGQHNRDLRAEAGYNLECMRTLTARLDEYLACKGIFMPNKFL